MLLNVGLMYSIVSRTWAMQQLRCAYRPAGSCLPVTAVLLPFTEILSWESSLAERLYSAWPCSNGAQILWKGLFLQLFLCPLVLAFYG